MEQSSGENQAPTNPTSEQSKHRRTDSPVDPLGAHALHQLSGARHRQGLSLRAVSKRLGTTIAEARRQEDPQTDIRLSELYAWQAALEVPLDELLCEPDDALSPRVLDRARMLRIMKTVQALRAKAKSNALQSLTDTLVSQLTDLMPELESVSAWPSVGQRRTSDELGKIVDHPIPENWVRDNTRFGNSH